MSDLRKIAVLSAVSLGLSMTEGLYAPQRRLGARTPPFTAETPKPLTKRQKRRLRGKRCARKEDHD